jgi:glycerol-3-phosphate dehydrogenase (NAD(P)+)
LNTVREAVLIVGYGEMGHAMEHLLAPRHAITIWNRDPVAGLEPVDLEAAAAQAGIVIYCIPLAALATMAGRIRPRLSADSLSLTMSKGLDEDGRTAPEVLAAAYDGQYARAALYGPMIAEELSAGRPGFAQLGVPRPADRDRVLALFRGSRLYLEPAADITGIAWSSLLKNVYAILVGAADALELGDNVRGYLFVAALAEMRGMVTALGGEADTCLQLAGLGDLVTTATSANSHHYTLGGRLARGETGDLVCEGVHTLQVLSHTDHFRREDFPLFHLVDAIVQDPAGLESRILEYLARRYGAPARVPG